MFEAVEVIHALQDVVGVGASPIRMSWCLAWLVASGVILPILAGSAAWGRDLGDGDIGAGAVEPVDVTLDVSVVTGKLGFDLLVGTLELEEVAVGAVRDGPGDRDDLVARDWG